MQTYRLLQVVVALVLLTAGILKVVGFVVERSSFPTHVSLEPVGLGTKLQYGVVAAEFFVAFGLLLNVTPKAIWMCAIVLFTCFGIASFTMAMLEIPSCGCFGAIRVSPWVSLGLDAGVVMCMVSWFPNNRDQQNDFSTACFMFAGLAYSGAVGIKGVGVFIDLLHAIVS